MTNTRASELALAIYQDALSAIRADNLMRWAIRVEGSLLRLGDDEIDLTAFENIFAVGAGKASAQMAVALEELLGNRLADGVVVTKYGHSLPTRRIRMMEAGHPIPDEASVAAGRAIFEMASSASAKDLVICLLSGGASALMELPVEEVSLEELQTVTDLLLRAGADIQELNSVRACLSRLKAGGLARAAYPAKVVCLVISDVLGNPLNVIGSGPCYLSEVDRAKAASVIRGFGLWDSVPECARAVLSIEAVHSDEFGPRPDHFIIGDIHSALTAAKASAERRGLQPLILTASTEGEAREVGRTYGQIAADLPASSKATGFDCIVAGGETTVTVTGSGKGGRSQELALAAASKMQGVEDICLLAAGTDGTDGPTDAAGAVVEGDTDENAVKKGLDIDAALTNNDAFPLLDALGCLIRTGPTQSNVGDLVIVVSAQASRGQRR